MGHGSSCAAVAEMTTMTPVEVWYDRLVLLAEMIANIKITEGCGGDGRPS
jgi:hypothetical protein